MSWTVESLAAAIRGRHISAAEATQEFLARIARLDPVLRAFITVDGDGARHAAAVRDAELAAGRVRGPLHGVPVAYEDLCAVPGLPTSCGTRRDDYLPANTLCTAADRLSSAGTVTLGKLNMSELAVGTFGDNAHRGDVVNPWRPGHCAGGSASGCGAAVAAGLVPAALGSDTGGGIRIPAAWCGIVGFKPTYGRVSRAGAMSLSWSNDHLGPMTSSVRDTALVLDVIAGFDPVDATSSRRPVPEALATVDEGVRGLKIGVPDNAYFDGIAPDTAAGVLAVARALGEQGARVDGIRVPDPQAMLDVASLVAAVEGTAVHARMLHERPDELQPAVRARLTVGLHVSAHDYLQASRLRARLTRVFLREVFADVDLLLVPTVTGAAPALRDVTVGPVDALLRRTAGLSRLTRPFSGLGLPALAVPCGFTADGLPLSAQIVGRPFDEPTVLRAGRAWEHAVGGFERPS
jgi:aspartyl-tRNA(Asn)/glutamyl-tRNA(Gln) amidotransferase subunit A